MNIISKGKNEMPGPKWTYCFLNIAIPYILIVRSLFNSFIEISFIYLKIHPLKVYSAVVFEKFTALWSLHHKLLLEHFINPERIPVHNSRHSSLPPPTSSPV